MNIIRILKQANNWLEFKELLQPLGNKEKGDCFELLTWYYLTLEPKYASKLDMVWMLNEIPTKVRRHIKLPEQDEGIDLLAKTKEGEYWAIQCKYRDNEESSITRKELSTFTDLSFSICKNISLCLICTTTCGYSRKLQLYGDRVAFCTSNDWQKLDSEFFHRLHRSFVNEPDHIEPLKPRPHQEDAITNAYNHFIVENNSRGKMIMPCGTGKSLAAYWITEQLDAKRILVLVPSIALIRQTLDVWLRQSLANNKSVSWICVCSDQTLSDNDNYDSSTSVQDLGIQIHTNPNEIENWLKIKRDGLTVVFSTYQSGKALSEASRNASFSFDVGIFDEAHKTVGDKHGLFSLPLSDDFISIKKRIFMTATERRYQGNNQNIVSMDDIKVYGETFELLSFKEALDMEPPILCNYKIAAIIVDKSEIAELIEENVFLRPNDDEWDDYIEAQMLASVVALKKAFDDWPIKHAVSFHRSIDRAKKYKESMELLNKSNNISMPPDCYHVSGKTPISVRHRIMDDFAKADRSIITNARCLTEGVDIPNIDCILFADPKRSTVDIVQAVGRAMRPSKGKDMGYIIIPILINSEIDSLEELHNNAFETIITVLRALATNDERIVEYFSEYSKRKEGRVDDTSFEINIPIGMNIDIAHFCNSIKLRVWSRLSKLSWRPFEEAREFVSGLNLQNKTEWQKYCRGEMPEKGFKPDDIPSSPDSTYRRQGWVGWDDWFGHEYRPFEEAREFVRGLGIRGLGIRRLKEWQKYCRGEMPEKGIKPDDIPDFPNIKYKNKGWLGWDDWYDAELTTSQWRSFEKAREFVRGLGIHETNEWDKYCRGEMPEIGTKPDDISSFPDLTYKNLGWVGWNDWLGIEPVVFQWRPFVEAREFVRGLELRGRDEWRKYCRGEMPEKGIKPNDIPATPWNTYRNQGWVGTYDWFGTEPIATQFRSFQEAREFVRGLELRGKNEWRKYCRGEMPEKGIRPNDIPVIPWNTYRNQGWVGTYDWFGTEPMAIQYRPFEEAREFIRGLGLRGLKEWQKYCRGEMPEKGIRPSDIPSSPNVAYKNNGWNGITDWLGFNWRAFEDARKFARGLELCGFEEWQKYCRGELSVKGSKPHDIPSFPNLRYKNLGWLGWDDWLGFQ